MVEVLVLGMAAIDATIRWALCGPIGPTEQLPLVARLVNALDLDIRSAHFWGMDEWIGDDGQAGAERRIR